MTESEKPSPQESPEIKKSRTLSDAKFIEGGADYAPGEYGPRLELTPEQLEEVKKEFESVESERSLQREVEEEKEKFRIEFSEKIESVKSEVDRFIESFPPPNEIKESDIDNIFRMTELGFSSYDGIGEFALKADLPIEVTSYMSESYTGGKKVIFKGGRFGNVNWYKMSRGEFAAIRDIMNELGEKLDKFKIKIASEIMKQQREEFENYRMNIEHFLSMFEDLGYEGRAFDHLKGINAEGFEGNSIAVIKNKLSYLSEIFKDLASENSDPAYRDFLAQAEFYRGVVKRYVSFEDREITGSAYRTSGYGNNSKGENAADASEFLLMARYWPRFQINK